MTDQPKDLREVVATTVGIISDLISARVIEVVVEAVVVAKEAEEVMDIHDTNGSPQNQTMTMKILDLTKK